MRGPAGRGPARTGVPCPARHLGIADHANTAVPHAP